MSRLRIAHLSDPHFGTLLEGVEAGLLQSLKELKADVVLISGDITQRARRDQFKAAARFKTKLAPVTAFAVPGNHDIPLFNVFGRFFSPYHGFHSHFQISRETVMEFGEIRIVGLNSTSRWRHIQGQLDEARVLPALVNKDPKTQVHIVVVHHPFTCAQSVDEKNLMKGAGDTLKVFEEAKVDLVLTGHIHDPYFSLSVARYPEIKRPMIFSGAGTCLSRRTRRNAPNSFNVLDVETNADGSCSIQASRHDIGKDFIFRPLPGFTAKYFRPARGNWVSEKNVGPANS